MLPNPDIWRSLTPGRRIVIWLSALCLLMMLWGGYFLSWPWQARTEDRAQLQRQYAVLATQQRLLWQRERTLPRNSIEEAARTTSFSALHFQSAESSLVSWKPDEKGGELVLETYWSSLPALFYHLAEREMTPGAFTIAPADSKLRFTLHLETFGEP